MLRNESVPVSSIDGVQFVDLSPSDISPEISKCDIKVMYLGKNRNGSYIDRETATKMSKTLRGTPIVGAYREDVEDFGDHGEVIHIEDGEIKFSCKTVPYGFVAPDAKVWFQKFNDINEIGEETTREYLMTTGYLWTGQYPEINKCINEGQGQSMEIDNLEGHWTQDKNNVEFFIINDAIFTKLCVMGDDVEPCFEGASVTSPEVSEHFSVEQNFSHTLFAMMNELKNAFTKGGSMPVETVEETVETPETVPAVEEETPAVEEFSEVEESNEDSANEEEFAAKKDDKKDDTDTSDGSDNSDTKDDSTDSSDDSTGDSKDNKSDDAKSEDKSDEDPKKKHALEDKVDELTNSLKKLNDKFAALEQEAKELREFKAERINADKDATIAKYHMLSDEDKADIVANKDKFTLSEIESKLALLYVQKNVDFDEEEADAEPLTTFSLNDDIADDADPMLAALREAQNL